VALPRHPEAADEEMGSCDVMLSVDYPFEKTELAAQFIEDAKFPQTDHINVACENVKRIHASIGLSAWCDK
jgi:hypothetical protein